MQFLIDYLNNKKECLVNFEINTLIAKCKSHSILPILYKACKRYKVNLTKEQDDFLKKNFLLNITKESVQEYEYKKVIDLFERENIRCLPLKGIEIKDVYDSPEDRTMCDIDLLYDKNQCKKVKKIMLVLGYSCNSYGGTHDVYFKKPYVTFEMHRVLIDEKYSIFNSYYSNIWDVVNKKEGRENIYEMSCEDAYIYMIVHMARHFSSGGIGFRYLIDIWLYTKKKKLNEKYIQEELEKIKINIFEMKMRNLSISLFEYKDLNDEQKQLYDFIINSGTYGNIIHSQALKKFMGKSGYKVIKMNPLKYYFCMLFPTFKQMKSRNHILKKYPIFLPYFYVERIFNAIFKRRKLTIAMIKGVKKYDKETAKKIQEIHEKMGI